jgi:indolepyruvate ferredoxin oxidoreductase beta subunit
MSIQSHQGGEALTDIYLVGVGGQGIITASRIIGEAAILADKNVLLSETHGMAQRGGSVVCTARIGDMRNPLILDGGADVLLSFEILETLRGLCKASKKTLVVASSERIVPLSVSKEKLKYPTEEEVSRESKKLAGSCTIFDARRIAEDAGVPMSSNVVMIGALAGTKQSGLSNQHFEEALQSVILHKLDENLAAFRSGANAVSAALSK